jgi:hypothetical protein
MLAKIAKAKPMRYFLEAHVIAYVFHMKQKAFHMKQQSRFR